MRSKLIIRNLKLLFHFWAEFKTVSCTSCHLVELLWFHKFGSLHQYFIFVFRLLISVHRGDHVARYNGCSYVELRITGTSLRDGKLTCTYVFMLTYSGPSGNTSIQMTISLFVIWVMDSPWWKLAKIFYTCVVTYQKNFQLNRRGHLPKKCVKGHINRSKWRS